MGGQADRRTGGLKGRRWVVLIGAVLLSAGPAVRPSACQVGYPPDQSPYHDIKSGATIVFGAGHLGGGHGVVGVGPSDGDVFGVRYERPLNHTLGFSVNVANALTTRLLVDPTKDSISRTSGPVDNAVIIVDAGFHMVLTGGKTWHGIAPYLGISVGAAFSTRVPSDTSEYAFGTKVTFGPQLGLRWYVARGVSLRADGQVLFWRLSYPLQYREPAPDGSRVLSTTSALTEWTRHPWLSVGVGWTF